MTIETTCPVCGRTNHVELNDEEAIMHERWRNRELLIQDALPNKSYDEREMLITGICPECWKKLFGQEE